MAPRCRSCPPGGGVVLWGMLMIDHLLETPTDARGKGQKQTPAQQEEEAAAVLLHTAGCQPRVRRQSEAKS